MKITNYSSIDTTIHAAADLENALPKSKPESSFQVGDAQLKAIIELAKIFNAETKIPNRDALPTPPDSLMKKRTKLPKVEYQTDPPPRVDPYKEYESR